MQDVRERGDQPLRSVTVDVEMESGGWAGQCLMLNCDAACALEFEHDKTCSQFSRKPSRPSSLGVMAALAD